MSKGDTYDTIVRQRIEGLLEGLGETVMNLIKYLFFILFYLTSLTKMTHGGHRTIYLKEILPPHQRIRKLSLNDLKEKQMLRKHKRRMV